MKEETIPSIKNKGFFKAICLLLILLIMGTGGYTYARFMSQEKGKGSAEVANWTFEIVKEEGEETKTVTLGNKTNTSMINGKIAPGTSGSFIIKLDATGTETNVDYSLKFENEKNKPRNLKFVYDGKHFNSLAEIGEITGTMVFNGEKTKIISVAWTWPYQTGTTDQEKQLGDQMDTIDATSLLDYTFDITAVGTQKN